MASTAETPSRAVEPYRLAIDTRERARQRVFEQIMSAWELAELAGLRRSSWAVGHNRHGVLAQRIRALDDARLFALWDGQPPTGQDEGETEVTDLYYQAIACSRLSLRVPEHLLITPANRVFGR